MEPAERVIIIIYQISYPGKINPSNALPGEEAREKVLRMTQNSHEVRNHTHTAQLPLPREFDSHKFG